MILLLVILVLGGLHGIDALSTVDISRHSFDDGFEQARGFSPPSSRGPGGLNETGQDEGWPGVDMKRSRSGFHFVGGSFSGELRMALSQTCRGTRTHGGRPYPHAPESCFSVPATVINSVDGSKDVYVAKYSPDRSLLWATHIGGPGRERFGGLSVGNLVNGGVPEEANHLYHVGEVYPRRASSSDTVLFAAGSANNDVTIMESRQGDQGFLMQAQSQADQVWVSQLNGSDGSVGWARTLAHCVANQSWSDRGPSNPYGEHRGECRVRAVAIDGNGDVIVTGRFWGEMRFPDTVAWTPMPVTPDVSISDEMDRDSSNQLKRAIGKLAYCQLPVSCCDSGPAPCEEHDSFFSYRFDETVETEHEQGDTVGVSVMKIKDALAIDRLEMMTVLREVPTVNHQTNAQGYITQSTNATKLREVRYSDQIQPLVHGSHIVLKVCNGSRYATNQLMDLDNQCNASKNDPNCIQNDCDMTYHCPQSCAHHSDCLVDSLSYCHNGTCTVDLSMCESFNGTLRQNRLQSLHECYYRSGKGRYCAFDQFVAKLGRDGSFRWAHKITHLLGEHSDSSGNIQKEKEYWADRAMQVLEVEKQFEFESERVDLNFPTSAYPWSSTVNEAELERLRRLQDAKTFYRIGR